MYSFLTSALNARRSLEQVRTLHLNESLPENEQRNRRRQRLNVVVPVIDVPDDADDCQVIAINDKW